MQTHGQHIKGAAVPVHAMKTEGRRVVAPVTSTPSTRWGGVPSLTPRLPYTRVYNAWYPQDKSWMGPTHVLEVLENKLPLPEIEPRIVQPVASIGLSCRCTEGTTRFIYDCVSVNIIVLFVRKVYIINRHRIFVLKNHRTDG